MPPCNGGGKMSRSFKKTPICKDCTGTKCLQWSKRQANKKVRRTRSLASGKAYRKVYDSWNIHDYSFRKTKNEYLKSNESSFKHDLMLYGSMENMPERCKRHHNDFKLKNWKKYYYWK
jgi:hypothetical protein